MGRRSSQEQKNHDPNPKRAAAKLKRKKGILAMKAANMNQIEWSKKFDPLYKVKGIERHLATH